MADPFLGSAALARGMSWGQLQKHQRLYRDVYVHPDAEVTAALRARAAWLWSRERAVVAGFAAAALHGSKWVDPALPVDLFHDNRHRLAGLRIHGDRLDPADVCRVDGVPVTKPARTALDIACWHPIMTAVAAIDALARATELKPVDVETLAETSTGRRGISRARRAIGLFDSGAQSPKETWLRILLVENGLPRPRTQIPVRNEFGVIAAYLDMGWDELKVAVEYDGDHHRVRRSQYSYDIRRLEMLHGQGWIIVRVTADDKPHDILSRVRAALARRARR